MPELPEVETVRRSLEPHVRGRSIRNVRVFETRLRTPLQPRRLRRQLRSRVVRGIGRRSKYLLFHLDSKQTLVLHLGMTGRLLLQKKSSTRLPHTHVCFELDGDEELRFLDHRKFGMLFVVDDEQMDAHPRFAVLGPEPFGQAFSVDYLVARAARSARPIKNFLMDASVVVGVGNIYASEALFRASVHPETPAGKLRRPRWQRVHAVVRQTLQEALRAGGSSISDFRDGLGEAGYFQLQLDVYGRQGRPCRNCQRPIRRLVQAGRSTFLCGRCQR